MSRAEIKGAPLNENVASKDGMGVIVRKAEVVAHSSHWTKMDMCC